MKWVADIYITAMDSSALAADEKLVILLIRLFFHKKTNKMFTHEILSNKIVWANTKCRHLHFLILELLQSGQTTVYIKQSTGLEKGDCLTNILIADSTYIL